MNPELQAKLVGYLDKLERAAERLGDAAEREIPEVAREWLTWLAVERFAYAAAFLAAGLVAAFAGRYLVRCARAMDSFNRPEALFFSWLFAAVAPTLLVAASGFWALQGTKVLVAPRVVLVESIAALAKGAKP